MTHDNHQSSSLSSNVAADHRSVSDGGSHHKSASSIVSRGILTLVAVLAVVAAGAWSKSGWNPFDKSAASTMDITATVKRSNLSVTFTERGELESSSTVDVRCEVEGSQNKIVEIVPEGTHVTAGQLVVRFDTEELMSRYAQQEIEAKQAEAAAQAAKEQLEVDKNKASSDIAAAKLALTLAELDHEKYIEGDYQVELDDIKGAIELARRDLQKAQEKLENTRDLFTKGFATPEEVELQETEVARARHSLTRDQAKLNVLEKFTRKRQETELVAKAEEAQRNVLRTESTCAAAVAKTQGLLEAANVTARLELARLERLKRQLENCEARAPHDGIVVYSKDGYWNPSTRIQLGGMVHFQQTLFSLPDLSQMQVKVKVHESVVKQIRPGQKTEVRVSAYPDRVLHGTVEKVSNLAHSEQYGDSGVREYLTWVKLHDLPQDAGLKPNMTAEVKIHVQQLNDVLVVPIQAVSELQGQYFSFIATPHGVDRRGVSIGENNQQFIEIKSGLEAGDRVVLDARTRLMNDAGTVESNDDKSLDVEQREASDVESLVSSNRP